MVFKYISDKLILKLASIFGFPGEDENLLEVERENLRLKKDLYEERLRNSNSSGQAEIIALRQRVDELTEDKIFLLEQENAWLRNENQMIKQLATPSVSQISYTPSFKEIIEFTYREGIFEYYLHGGLKQERKIDQVTLIGELIRTFPELEFNINHNNLTVSSRSIRTLKRIYPLDSKISVAVLTNFNFINC
ncbi:hypothetical protein [Lysinibacillus irui]|uniref:Uncharacterized protein n=1 Tax=Lysinibacillus irui TaxID=2998077 RepID=A0AAJ5RMT3_9BACI|nr:hypothetical protein [Lysinibacillus irui]WDV09317.1 hypothetical protein OU989_22605 [Lysinibacillus irui]